MTLMRDKVLRLTDDGLVYRRPDGSTYLRPYSGGKTDAPDEAAPTTNRAPDDGQSSTPTRWHPDHARATPAIKLRILDWLLEHGPARLTRLARGTQITQSRAYRHCRDMAVHQLIARHRVAGGRDERHRHYELSITPRGQRMLENWREHLPRLKSEAA